MTPEGQAAGAWDPAYSGRLDLGDDSVGFEVPNALTPGQATYTTSQRLTHQDMQRAYEEEIARQLEEVDKESRKNAIDKAAESLYPEKPKTISELLSEAVAKHEAEQNRLNEGNQRNVASDGVEYGSVPGKVATSPTEALVALMADPETTREVAERMSQRESKLKQEQEAYNLSEQQVQRLRQGVEHLDRLKTAVTRAYSEAKGKGYSADVAVLLSSGVAVKEGFKYLFRQTARELVDTYSNLRENSFGVVPFKETCVEGFFMA